MPHRAARRAAWLVTLFAAAVGLSPAASEPGAAPLAGNRALLDAPLLFVKRHAYMSGHIYDDYYTWHPGGGIYILENPRAPTAEHRIRPVIDPTTKETLGEGVYRDPELSYDAKRIVFAFKGAANGDTSIYEIGIDGKGLRRLTEPGKACSILPPVRALGLGRHDVYPCYLPDGRIVFNSTRQGGRVPCFNSEVDNLHVMNADGSGVRVLSVNNVNEFDPVVLPDGRILYGRWEYVDKTALYMQSLWTIFPDGTNETAFFANNLAKPTALLDPRPVPGSHLVVCTLTPHNGQSVGAIAMIEPTRGKNNLDALTSFTPEFPKEMDQGLARGPSDPWPLSKDVVLISNNAKTPHGVIELIDRSGRRETILSDPTIGCFSPMLVKPRPKPAVLAPAAQPGRPAGFFVQDITRGLPGVRPGEVKRLRVVEETARVSGIPKGGRWWNQAFLMSWQGAYVVKSFLGTVPVEPDGSVHFEAPPGRALYFQALDGDGRLVQSMRTFVQAVPGVTRSCVGCHEYKYSTPPVVARGLPPKPPDIGGLGRQTRPASAAARAPSRLEPEAWGSGFVDYPTMAQPVWDRHCVRCHGGAGGIAGGIDLSGGWTWAFNLSYETLLRNTLAGFLNCENGAVLTSLLQPPRAHGSGQAPLAELLLSGHKGRVPNLTAAERSLIFAWMDGNGNYYGTWDWAEDATCEAVLAAGASLTGEMRDGGCVKCHAPTVGADWINLRDPEQSRILRAPLAPGSGLGLGWCRQRKARPVAGLVTQAHQPPDVFRPQRVPPPDPAGTPVTPFASTDDAHYHSMLAVVWQARGAALARPRVDMPGAEVHPGVCRQLVPVPLPARAPSLRGSVEEDGVVTLAWERSAQTIGLGFEVHRSGRPGFTPGRETLVATTTRFAQADAKAPAGKQHYALVALSGGKRSNPAYAALTVPKVDPPMAPGQLSAVPRPGEVELRWDETAGRRVRYLIRRVVEGGSEPEKLHDGALAEGSFLDRVPPEGVRCRYQVAAIDRRGQSSQPAATSWVRPLPEPREPLFAAAFRDGLSATVVGRGPIVGEAHGPAKAADGALDLRGGGFVTFAHQPSFDLAGRFTLVCRVFLEDLGNMPVLVSCGHWQREGWFLQRIGAGWRWYLGGVACDGGQAQAGRWVHLVATFDGREARVYQDGRQVAAVPAAPDTTAYSGPLVVGQYSSPDGAYQVPGRMADVRVYRCAFTPEQAAALFRSDTATGR